MRAGIIKRHAKLLAALVLLIAGVAYYSVHKLEAVRLDEIARGEAMFYCLTAYASDNSGSFPPSLKVLLTSNWDIGESFVYDDQGEVRWAYPLNDRTRQTSRGDLVLFRSAKEIDGAVLEVTVDGGMRWREASGEITEQEVPKDLELSSNSESEGFPRFIVVLGDTRLSFYNTWTKEEVLKRIDVAEYSYPSYFQFRMQAGRLESLGGREVVSDEWYLDEENGKWRFEEFAFPRRKSAEMRVVSKDFDSMREAVDWYVREKIEPLLNDETN